METIYKKVENIESMQEQAIRRAKQMHQKAKKPISLKEYEKFIANPENIACDEKDEKIKFRNGSAKIKTSNLDFLLKDSEQTLILVLLFLLFEEKNDIGLILALMYLLL